MTTKEALLKQCVDLIESRHQGISRSINEIKTSLLSETKSSAGDKHETGRAMLQLEREKAGTQLAEINKEKKLLAKIDIERISNKISSGSLVYTTQHNYFIAVSVGQLTVNNENFYAISAKTPIGQLLIGKSVGDEIEFRKNKFIIKEVI